MFASKVSVIPSLPVALFLMAPSTIKYVNQLNSVDGNAYQSPLPQPSVRQFGLIKWTG